MAYCSKCGSPISEGSQFCPTCGEPVARDNNQRKETFDGTIHKCPNCGQVLDAFSVACPSCGYELRDAHAVTSLRELSLCLQEVTSHSEKDVKQTFFERLRRDTTDVDNRAAALIMAFPIPNTREDLIEFIVVSASNIDVDAFNEMKRGSLSPSEIAMSSAWLSKLEQAYQKASITLSDDAAFERIKTIYDGTMKKVSWSKHAMRRFWLGFVIFWVVLIVFCQIMVMINPEVR